MNPVKKYEIESSSILKDYNTLEQSLGNVIFNALKGMAFMFFIGFIFYQNIMLSSILSVTGIYYVKLVYKKTVYSQKWELNIQFKDLLYFLSTSLSAGRSLENSFIAALSSLQSMYCDDKTFIIIETKIIISKLAMSESIEKCLYNLAQRSGVEDIINFADVVIVCKRKGGNLNEVIRNTSSIIKDRIEIRQEIETMLAGKKIEQILLSISPVAMILFLTYTAYDFIRPVFETHVGHFVMTVALALTVCGYLWSRKIMDISV